MYLPDVEQAARKMCNNDIGYPYEQINLII